MTAWSAHARQVWLQRRLARCCSSGLIVALLTSAVTIARADDDAAAKQAKTELTPAPLIGASTDLGVGGGLVGSFSRREPGIEPYLYRIQLASMTMFKLPHGTVQVPYVDNYVDLDLPHLVSGRFKLQVRAEYTREAAVKYYGIGNASRVPKDRSLNAPEYAYGWQHPGFTAKLSERIAGPLWLVFTLGYSFNTFEVKANSKLDRDRHGDAAFFDDRIGAIATHSDLTLGYAAALDTRDNEVSPARGQYHTLRLALSPGGAPGVSGPWGRVDAALRGYIPLNDDGMVLAMRAVSDALFGRPPIYELARYDDVGMLGTGALGGPNGVRGIPAQRYHGMLKLFGNVEFRAYVLSFHLLDKTNRLGFVVFADAGRVWADYGSNPALDGRGLGLKYGLGAGLRLLGGKTFVLRADIAWSPDARPVGGYLAADHAF